MTELEFGQEQMKVMRVLWEKKHATAQQITDAINETEPIKHISVQMLLRKLVQKGAIGYDVENRTYIYYPLVNKEKTINNAMRNFVNHIFAGSKDDLVSYIIKNEFISEKKLKEIRALLNKDN
ncbi:MAG: BlaI/MecI/CopY family transcriptional regulator [Candidatus Latescibacteria bacterium]|nr:BlaI/MecI/CopY family transcriptional regulator [Candidatus Latescibacterota bacterium]